MDYKRTLNLHNLLKKKSFFLFGPRTTGKSYLTRKQLGKSAFILNLLRPEIYLKLSSEPYLLESLIDSADKYEYVVIDEVQRIPELLNEIHRLIEERKITFLLTGSSARKLKQAHVNLLAGRARQAELFPLTYNEIPNFSLKRYCLYGGLPAVYQSDEPDEELQAYINTYLKEEIQAEALVRKIPSFIKFLQTASLCSGQIINFSKLSRDTNIPTSTIREYFYILEDTFTGFLLPTYSKTKKRKALSMGKFYLFDIGVRNALSEIDSLPEKTEEFGNAFEHFIGMELRAYLSYRRIRKHLTFWITQQHKEVDFIIGDDVAIEVKATTKTDSDDIKNLKLLQEENLIERFILVSQDTVDMKKDGIERMHWKNFLNKLWNDELV